MCIAGTCNVNRHRTQKAPWLALDCVSNGETKFVFVTVKNKPEQVWLDSCIEKSKLTAQWAALKNNRRLKGEWFSLLNKL